MATATYIALANLTFTGDSSITFSSIPATYRDLVLIVTATSTSSQTYCRVNGDGNNGNYFNVQMRGNSSGAQSSSDNPSIIYVFHADGDNGSAIMHFMDYSVTDKHKTVLVRSNAGTGEVGAIASRWANTNAITSIEIFPNSATMDGSVALYGIVS